MVIQTFGDRLARKVFERRVARELGTAQKAALSKLLVVDAAESLEDLARVPGNRLEKLGGDRKGLHSIRINDRWRVCFRWSGRDAFDVQIVDYHRG